MKNRFVLCAWIGFLLGGVFAGGIPAQGAADVDFDGNGRVDLGDFILFARAFGTGEARYDFSGNGVVDLADFLVFARAYGQGAGRNGAQVMYVVSPANTEHEMVLVPAGEFSMGANLLDSDEYPAHTVSVDAFLIDRFEVTNAQYAVFLNTIGKNADEAGNEFLDLDDDGVQIALAGERFEPKGGFGGLPVVEVTWFGAQAYCAWLGGRLPTEAEWEKAARGTDGRTYPWGDEANGQANYWNSGDPYDNGPTQGGYFDGTNRAGFQTLNGSSPYGVHDMAGNVWEWCRDNYDRGYYARSPRENPQGAGDGNFRVVRGGSWFDEPFYVRAANRDRSRPEASVYYLGFRCAREP